VKAAADAGLRPPEGPWDNLMPDEILGLADGSVPTVEVRWDSKRTLLDRTDGIHALPAVRRRDDSAVHAALLAALRAQSPKVRIAALDILLYIALRGGKNLFDALEERIDDADESVRKRARDCLKECAPIFPSALEEIIREQIRSEDATVRTDAFQALRAASIQWPEVGVLHVDELIREEEVDLRRRGAKILRSFAPRAGAGGWDLIGWCLQDEDAQVRKGAAMSLPALASRSPDIAQLLIEVAIFDEEPAVSRQALKALNRVDKDSVRVRDLIVDAARHRDKRIRASCIKMLPVILSGESMRETADELLRQETDPELRKILTEYAKDLAMEGTEDEKNKFLAPAPAVEIDPAELIAQSTLPQNKDHYQHPESKTASQTKVAAETSPNNRASQGDGYYHGDEADEHFLSEEEQLNRRTEFLGDSGLIQNRDHGSGDVQDSEGHYGDAQESEEQGGIQPEEHGLIDYDSSLEYPDGRGSEDGRRDGLEREAEISQQKNLEHENLSKISNQYDPEYEDILEPLTDHDDHYRWPDEEDEEADEEDGEADEDDQND
jgi:hypothetical protein